jgi:hypothetical protein
MGIIPIAYRHEYYSWRNMKTRCLNPRSNVYSHYGARGIKVCDRWLNSFENFLEDLGHKPGPEYSLDRKNNDGHYEPRNNTRKQQALRIKRMWLDKSRVPFKYGGPQLF